MSVRTYRVRRGLKGSATEDWIITALARQREPHSFTANPRTGNCDERPGWRDRYRLHVADAVIAVIEGHQP